MKIIINIKFPRFTRLEANKEIGNYQNAVILYKLQMKAMYGSF